jgi:RHS repeat-associated protein
MMARARYLVRELNPVNFRAGGYVVVDDVYTDYDGDEAYGDYQVVTFQPDPLEDPIPFGSTIRGFEPGLGTFEYEADPAFDPHCAPIFDPDCSVWPTRPDASTVKFYHGDHLGTTRFMTDATGAAVQSSVYSAFGMRASGTNHRYGYDGAWGYQSHSFDEVPFGMDPDTAFPFLHVGHRYYDPSTGRFLQRDPIGIGGGLNVYGYVDNVPSRDVDPEGLAFTWVGWGAAGPLAGCGGLLIAIADRIIKPAIDRNTERRERDGYRRINSQPPPKSRKQREQERKEQEQERERRRVHRLRGLPGIGG